MEQQFKSENEQRMTPVEAEEVLKRFREEEEARQKEMEARASHPTVSDLAEGLGVPPERIASLLSEVRGKNSAPTPFKPQPLTVDEAQAQVRRSNNTAWFIAAALIGALLVLGVFAVMFTTVASERRVETPVPVSAPPGSGTTTPVEDGQPLAPPTESATR